MKYLIKFDEQISDYSSGFFGIGAKTEHRIRQQSMIINADSKAEALEKVLLGSMGEINIVSVEEL